MSETIAAIATAAGGGVGIVRLSGPRAEEILRALCPRLGTLESHKLTLTHAVAPGDGDGEVLDEVLAVVMRAPKSYTGEDVVELHAHGGGANLERLLHAVLDRGARLATAGEFTRRAFLAGKIDLVQAEAVAAVIGARDARSLRAAHALRRGALGKELARVRSAVIDELAELEGAIDFPDETDAAPEPRERAKRLRALGAELRARADRFRRALGTVPEVVLVGAVNAGKSSLLNALVGEERALVDEQPGTTRDVVEAELELDGTLVRMLDTAGLRADPTELELRGQKLAEQRRHGAALTILVVDGARGWTSADEALQRTLARHGALLVVESKADMATSATRPDTIRVSSRSGAGLDTLRARIAAALDDDSGLTSPRQAEALRQSGELIERGVDALVGASGPSAPEVAAVDLRHALAALGRITGETVDSAVLDALFSRFCIGK